MPGIEDDRSEDLHNQSPEKEKKKRISPESEDQNSSIETREQDIDKKRPPSLAIGPKVLPDKEPSSGSSG